MLKTVLVTGANRGIGLGFCKQYIKYGYRVYAACRSPESSSELLALKQKFPDQLDILPLDVTNQSMVAALPHMLEGRVIDILINNAGVYGPKGLSLGDITESDWLDVFKVNVIAPLLLTQLLVENITASQEKKVILMTSKMGSITDNSSGGSYIYRSSKSALNAVGKSLAHDLSSKGVKVALAHPGWVQTSMGGANALIDVKTSVNGLCKVIEELDEESSGQFFNYDGSLIPW